MKFTIAFLIMLVVHMNSAFPPTDSNCLWTGCEGKTHSGVDICDDYVVAGRFTGRTNYKGCLSDAYRVECCKPLPPGTVKWTKSCYGTADGGDYLCNNEYGDGFRATGKKRKCFGTDMTLYECRN